MATTIFDKPVETPVREPDPVRPPDYFNLYATLQLGAPEGWRWVVLDCSKKSVPEGYAKVEGAVCPAGRNGRPSWKKRDVATHRTFFFKLDDFRAWEKQYAAKQGKCYRCWGSGKELASSHRDGTKTFRTCFECKGSGLPAASSR